MRDSYTHKEEILMHIRDRARNIIGYHIYECPCGCGTPGVCNRFAINEYRKDTE